MNSKTEREILEREMEIEIERRDPLRIYGFKDFYGRRIYRNGKDHYENFARLSLELEFPPQWMEYFSLNAVCDDLCVSIKHTRKKILLDSSPGATLYTSSGGIVTYEPFTLEQRNILEELYELRIDMKLFRNPFLYEDEYYLNESWFT